MEKKKSPGAVSLGGFLVGIAGIIVSMVGMGKLDVKDVILDNIPMGLFLLYLGFGIAAFGAIVWTVGILRGWDDIPEDKGCAGLRVFGVIPFILGVVTLLGGLRDKTGRMVLLGDKELFETDTFLMIVGGAMAVIGLLIWFIGYKKSQVKTTIMLRGSSRRAKFFRDYRSELKKISWQSWRDTYKQSGIVIAALVIFAIVVGVLDIVFYKSLNEWILNLITK